MSVRIAVGNISGSWAFCSRIDKAIWLVGRKCGRLTSKAPGRVRRSLMSGAEIARERAVSLCLA